MEKTDVNKRTSSDMRKQTLIGTSRTIPTQERRLSFRPRPNHLRRGTLQPQLLGRDNRMALDDRKRWMSSQTTENP
jgi:hypothetical protein